MLDVPLPGQLVAGKYLAQEELGRGGMGRVVAALHLSLDCPVALKFLSRADLDELALERFVREARAAAQIESEHVARVMDAARLETGVPYIVMERLSGVNLKTLLAREGRVAVEDAVDYLLQACDAIAEAHARGIVHRDLKPSNLFLCDRADGTRVVKVLDFGVSKMRREPALQGAETTSAEVLLGSPQYMAPEQIRSAKHADARSDIWSLGGILYELLAGVPAYRAETLPGLLASIVADEPRPLAHFRTDVPAALQSAVRRCLEKDPKRRFQSVADLARALGPFAPAARTALLARISRISGGAAEPAPVSARRAAPRRDGQAVWLGALGALLILLSLGLVSLRRPAAPRAAASEVPGLSHSAAAREHASTESSSAAPDVARSLGEEASVPAPPEQVDSVLPEPSRAEREAEPPRPSSVRAAPLMRAPAGIEQTASVAAPPEAPAVVERPPASDALRAPPAVEAPPASESAAATRAESAGSTERPRNPLDVFSDPR